MEATTKQRVQRIEDEATGADLNSWEKHEFLPSIKNRALPLSEKQDKILRQIERKVFGEEDE